MAPRQEQIRGWPKDGAFIYWTGECLEPAYTWRYLGRVSF